MKTLIIALNSKYIHSSLAAWYLKAGCGDSCGVVKVAEYSINDNPDAVLRSIYEEKCDVAAFSCYIWNMEMVLKTAENLKKVSPGTMVVLGGPEVSYSAYDILKSYLFIDFIVSGEGEIPFRLLLSSLIDSSYDFKDIEGVSFRKEGKIFESKSFSLVEDIDSIPSPYDKDMLCATGGKILYFESSRGCPFSCSYCISSTFSGVRYFSMDRVKKELLFFIEEGVKLVKFVDRTFNCNTQKAKEIFEFIIENAKETKFHFEVAADLFDDSIMEILSKAPYGLIQFEIGVQSTNIKTLEAVNRKTRLDRVFHYVRRLKELGNIHLHLDLIAGLPYEDYNSFGNSFNEVYNLASHKLQLGFLKLLKGAGILEDSLKYGYEYRGYQPYEVLSNKFIAFDEIMGLKGIEELVERYYNSGRFMMSLDYLIGEYFSSPFEFYEDLLSYYRKKGYLNRKFSTRDLYTVLLEFSQQLRPKADIEVVNELLKFDFLVSDNTNNLPRELHRNLTKEFRELCYDFLKNEKNIKTYLPEFMGLPAKKIINRVHFELFSYDLSKQNDHSAYEKNDSVLVFNYNSKDEVTGCYKWNKINL